MARDKGLAGQLIRGGIGSIALKISNALLGLGTVILLARILGPKGYGTYAYVLAGISIVSIPAQFGLPRLVVRETARAQVNNEWGLMRGILRWSSAAAAIISLVLALIGALVIFVWGRGRLSHAQVGTILFALILVPLMALGSLRGAALQGLRRVVLGKLPEQALQPAFLVIFVLFIYWCLGSTLTAPDAMGLNAAAAGLAFVMGAFFLYRSKPAPLRSRPQSVTKTREWMSAIWPLALVAAMGKINQQTDLVLLGVFKSAAEVGIYRVAVQGGTLVVFGLQTVAMFVNPYCARLHAQGDMNRLQKLIRASAWVSLLSALPLVLIYGIWGKFVIKLLFGVKYSGAYEPLLILALGQTVSAMFGPVAGLLNMTGHERRTARGVTIAAAANVILNLILIPYFGLVGAATATALTFCVWNVLLWWDARKLLGINSVCY